MWSKPVPFDATTFDIAQPVYTASSRAYPLSKRLFDLMVVVLNLPLVLPLCALIAVLIKIDSAGPVLFRQKRIGANGATFWVYKFRSMRADAAQAEGRVDAAQRGDSRITRIGGFLRRTSLDELPQLLNVLKGEMSLVGPRPHAVAHDAAFAETVPGYRGRYEMVPGLTGLAQIRKLRGSVEHKGMIRARVASDLHYIANWSLLFDLKVLLLTPVSLLSSSAY